VSALASSSSVTAPGPDFTSTPFSAAKIQEAGKLLGQVEEITKSASGAQLRQELEQLVGKGAER
jgi:hypothetical protein